MLAGIVKKKSRLLAPFLALWTFSAAGQSTPCQESWEKFDLFNLSVDFRFKVFTHDKTVEQKTGLVLEVIPGQRVKYDHLIAGRRLHLTNWSDTTISKAVSYLDVQVVCQVLNDQGEWQDIENPLRDQSFCGNEREIFELTLKKGAYLKLKAPCYAGTTPVRMRYRLHCKDLTVYSDEFEGYINPEQLENPAARH